MRARASACPARNTVWSIEGLTWVPVIATRSGWAILPRPTPRASAVARRAASTPAGLQSATAARRVRTSDSGVLAAAVKCLATAASS